MKKRAKTLRKEGYVTGSIFGKDLEGAISIRMNVLEIEAVLRDNWEGSEIVIDLEGKKMPVAIKEIQRNFLKHQFLEVDFQTIPKDGK